MSFIQTLMKNPIVNFIWTNLYARIGFFVLIGFFFISIFFVFLKKYDDTVFTDQEATEIYNFISKTSSKEWLYNINNILSDYWNTRKVFTYNGDVSFQEPATPIAEGIINFHHDLMFYLFIILFFVVFMLSRCIVLFSHEKVNKIYVVTHAPILEIIWTIIPAMILVIIAIPSFALLYSMDEIVDPAFTVKVIGHQWYWTYELTDPDVKNVLNHIQTQTHNQNEFLDIFGKLPYTEPEKKSWAESGFPPEFDFSRPENMPRLRWNILNDPTVFTVHILELYKANETGQIPDESLLDQESAEDIFIRLLRKDMAQKRFLELQEYKKEHGHYPPYENPLPKKVREPLTITVDDINALSLTEKDKTSVKNALYPYKEARIFKGKLRFDSYLVPVEDNDSLTRKYEYLLKVDNPLHVPVHLVVRVLVTSADVLHSWAVPSLGVKIDACPGRLNETSFYLNYASTFYGQCSEICGINHGFMPIVVHGHDFWEGRDIPEELIDQYVLLYLYLYKYMKVQKELGIL